ncbi:MAG: hypothetical protein QOK04_1285, partial [Solirubrobacteraceae bacterium]|nr:hypothetical protein [Solirubrobacteraceae bacterium]
MSEVNVDWSGATLESGAGNRFWVTAPITADHDDFWDLAFRAVLQEHASEVPEDSWNTIGVIKNNVVVEGVARGSVDTVRTFVDRCMERANEHIATDRAERLRALQDLEQLRAQDEEARELTRQLRKQS